MSSKPAYKVGKSLRSFRIPSDIFAALSSVANPNPTMSRRFARLLLRATARRELRKRAKAELIPIVETMNIASFGVLILRRHQHAHRNSKSDLLQNSKVGLVLRSTCTLRRRHGHGAASEKGGHVAAVMGAGRGGKGEGGERKRQRKCYFWH